MPVLDAKALETDPKGAAFLLSVLRRSPSFPYPAEDTPKARRMPFRLIRRYRVPALHPV